MERVIHISPLDPIFQVFLRSGGCVAVAVGHPTMPWRNALGGVGRAGAPISAHVRGELWHAPMCMEMMDHTPCASRVMATEGRPRTNDCERTQPLCVRAHSGMQHLLAHTPERAGGLASHTVRAPPNPRNPTHLPRQHAIGTAPGHTKTAN